MVELVRSKPSLLRRASLCFGEAGEKEKESAGNDGPPSAFYFFNYCYFYRDTQWEPLRRRDVAIFLTRSVN